MSAYPIDFSEPLKTGFSIPAGGFNGPGGSASNTSLRLYGRGALEWGESVDEDLVRLTENFASATPPKNPIGGQLWYQTKLYYHDTSAGGQLVGWYRFDPNTQTWSLLNNTGIVPGAPSSGQTYYYGSGTAGTGLYGYYSMVKPEAQAYVLRSYFEAAGAPASSLAPQQSLLVWDPYSNSANGSWTTPSSIFSSASAPSNPQIGGLWYDLSTGKLKVWNGSAWEEILGPSGTSTTTASSILDMGNYKIINLGTPSTGTDAATKAYVDAVGAAISGTIPTGSYLSTSGGTVTGPTTFTSTVTVSGNTSLQATTTASLSVTGAATIGSTLSIGGALNANGFRLTNVGNASAGTDAVNLNQLNTAIAGVSGSGSSSSSSIVYPGSGTYKAGDICIVGSTIYIAVSGGSGVAPGGGWRQVFPAVYS